MTLTPLDQNLHNDQDDREVLVRVENVSKKFCRSLKKSLRYGVQDIASELIGRKYEHVLRPDEFWSVRDVSFELRRGECLGLIGSNGAGKSTLLKMLNGLIKPDKGRIEINGRVGALIELGTGFNPILTGRENIYVNGALLGFSREEIEEKVENIIDFSEIREFIDTPVQNYSSGMKVRLGFAVAAQMEPDILLIDEVLAVGDVGFKLKCFNRIFEISKNTAIIFVSHSMTQITRIATCVMLLNKGGMEYYSSDISNGIEKYFDIFPSERPTSNTTKLVGLKDLKLNSHSVDASTPIKISYLDDINLEIQFNLDVQIKYYSIQIVIRDREAKGIAMISPALAGVNRFENKGLNNIKIVIPQVQLSLGIYYLDMNIRDCSNENRTFGEAYLASYFSIAAIKVSNKFGFTNMPFTLKSEWYS
jgi:lipopolysaccharide transport system ATP-binding protein